MKMKIVSMLVCTLVITTVFTATVAAGTPPEVPLQPTGPTEGDAGVDYEFSTITREGDGDEIFFKWDWSDEVSDWIGPHFSHERVYQNHSWNYEGTYEIKVKAKDVDGESGWSEPLVITITGNVWPDLECEGSLSWTDVTPGETVSGSFTVENAGDANSKLDWEIEEFPEWGEWTFTPASGDNLKPADGAVTVEVEVVAPDEEDQEFSGEVKIVNKDDGSDVCTIEVSLSTPINQNSIYLHFIQFLQNLIHRFPLLEKILLVFPVFSRILHL